MYYKNISYSVKTFYGVTFNPGETKEVPSCINDRLMIPTSAPVLKKTTNTPQKKLSSDNSKKEARKEKDKPVEVVTEPTSATEPVSVEESDS